MPGKGRAIIAHEPLILLFSLTVPYLIRQDFYFLRIGAHVDKLLSTENLPDDHALFHIEEVDRTVPGLRDGVRRAWLVSMGGLHLQEEGCEHQKLAFASLHQGRIRQLILLLERLLVHILDLYGQY